MMHAALMLCQHCAIPEHSLPAPSAVSKGMKETHRALHSIRTRECAARPPMLGHRTMESVKSPFVAREEPDAAKRTSIALICW